MKNFWSMVLCGLLVWLAIVKPVCNAAAAPLAGNETAKSGTNLGELRDWLNQRNQERKKLGLPGADMPKRFVTDNHQRWHSTKKTSADIPPKPEAVQPSGTPVLHIGHGPDGRIRVRYILKEDGPDQLQVYSGSGYSASTIAEDDVETAEKLAKLTPRGKKAWMAGRALKSHTAKRK